MIGNPALIEFIRRRIDLDGPVPFRWFMEQALYHPEHGYYSSGLATIGRRGDYFTNVSVGALYGKLLAGQFAEMWEHLGKPSNFTLVEQGANDGAFARDVLSALSDGDPECLAALRYVIVEPFGIPMEHQKRALAAFGNVRWVSSPGELAPFHGVYFSNELLDAMPVHRIRFTGGGWREQYVNGQFCFVDGPLSSERLREKIGCIPRIENYRTEVNLEASDWIEAVAGRLERGYVLAIDYGYPEGIYYSPERTDGSLAGYSAHERVATPLEAPGEIDITAHVDFTAVARRAGEAGFELAGFTDQHHFMVGLGKRTFQDSSAPATPALAKNLRAFKTLMHPGLMGLAFKALALRKGVKSLPLGGFEFARDPRTQLGL